MDGWKEGFSYQAGYALRFLFSLDLLTFIGSMSCSSYFSWLDLVLDSMVFFIITTPKRISSHHSLSYQHGFMYFGVTSDVDKSNTASLHSLSNPASLTKKISRDRLGIQFRE